ncbi:shikimate kinase [Winogradskyella aquimaris]|uniref:Shikimate kinase n=1 Tax=Winogradskyella aquimaris TaxID=864074 RepID=A0ABU5ELG3_9FLAO|nr:shikimate kinase [Winogradskyella aquimaris]MDY2587123.1 shikimate kinase [Winogradskyella aquimaris]
MIVALMGYMGSGKSTIGKELATVLNYKFLDLDSVISDAEKSSISDLFKKKGEIYFRKKEAFYLNEILKSENHVVLALGGGTPCYGNNLQLLLKQSKVSTFYLKLSLPLLSSRLFKEKNDRPLISHIDSEEALTEFIGKHLFERSQYYSQAKHIIDIDGKSQQDILEAILMYLI